MAASPNSTSARKMPRSKRSTKKAIRRKKERPFTIEQAAATHFEAVPDFKDIQEVEKFIQRNVVAFRIAISILGRSKEQLVEAWEGDDDLFMRLHHDLLETADWFRTSAEFIDKAALRLMVSGAASVVKTDP